MALPAQAVDQLEEAANRLAGEIVLAAPGGDDGLIPAYSLLSELSELTAGETALAGPIGAARSALDRRLDAGQPFDAETLGLLLRTVEWLQKAVTALRAGATIPIPDHPSDPSPGPGPAKQSEAGPAPAKRSEAWDETDPADELLHFDLEGNRELFTEFHAETGEHLAHIEAGALKLENSPDDLEALNAVFRSFHTIKGNAGFLGLKPMNLLAHEIETLLDFARNRELTLGPAVVAQILRGRDALEAFNQQVGVALERGVAPTELVPVSGLIATVRALVESRGALADVAHIARPRSAEGGEPGAEKPAPNGKARGEGAAATVRVSIDKLDTLMDVVGELVIVHSQLAETARRFGVAAPPLPGNVGQLSRITKELQGTAMALRMIPIQPTFQKMERLARDLARECRKSVAFTTQGGETELDRTMVEEIADPLVHMVRNALDHGLEPETERVAKGKPAMGVVELRALHQGGQILIELQDDGRGLDPERILAKARRQGLVPEGPPPPVEQIYQFIFLPGFSTADKVTSLSGRGVGMDVVKRNVERLRGKIEIASTLGKGTTFTIRLPLTMAIIDGLVVRVGDDRFILPTTSVQRALKPTRQQVVSIQGCGEVLDLNGRLLPLHRLHRHFGIPAQAQDPWDGILVVVETSGRSYALLVDEMISKQEVVIKNLGTFMSHLTGASGVAGGAILGDGHIALILDPAVLLQAA
ncbi:MAG TPA: chemotaxis protein CheA [Opitutaceae bacterium]|jgi:two-component system chemotaxis sensor kinase CheA|nr:chemotaxis protein CheA [Opitutaceae bacterium]